MARGSSGSTCGNLVDVLVGRSSVERRAVRLRRAFEGLGATFAKLAQQMSIRADMLPYAYCAELGRMLDQAPAFPTEEAIAIIERSWAGRSAMCSIFSTRSRSARRRSPAFIRPG